MTEPDHRKEMVDYWVKKARESLQSARDELKAGRRAFAVNRTYYGCFYAVSAYLLLNEQQFKKHSGVRAAFHKHLVKPGILDQESGKLYEELFEARLRGDYIELVDFD